MNFVNTGVTREGGTLLALDTVLSGMVLNVGFRVFGLRDGGEMRTRRIWSMLGALVIMTGGVFGAQSAQAADAFVRSLSCGLNYTCFISTNSTTSGLVKHFVNGVQTGGWPSGGSHSSSKKVNGSTIAEGSTGGSFTSLPGASCSCRPGDTCGG